MRLQLFIKKHLRDYNLDIECIAYRLQVSVTREIEVS